MLALVKIFQPVEAATRWPSPTEGDGNVPETDEAWRIHLVWQAMERGEISPARAAELLVDVPDDEGDTGQPVAAG